MLRERLKNLFNFKSFTRSKSSAAAMLVAQYLDEVDYNIDEAVNTYSSNVWVNACVGIRSEVFANVRFYIDKGGKRIDTHPILDLLNKPNRFFTRYKLMQLTRIHLDLTGNAYWKYDFSNGRIIGIQILDPRYMDLEISKSKFVSSYIYTINGQRIPLKPEQVTHFTMPSPKALTTGVAPLYSASYAIDTEKYSNKHNYNFFKNGGALGFIFEHENTLSDATKDKIKQEFKSVYGGSDKAFKTVVLDGGLKIKEISISQRDMEFSQLQISNRDKVIAVYRVPKILIAQYEGGSLAEAETAERIFMKYTMTPLVQSFVETLNIDLLPLYNDDSLELKFEPLVSEDKEFILKKNDNALNNWMTINERRELEGLDRIEGGDKLYQPISNVPIESVPNISNTGDKTGDKKAASGVVKGTDNMKNIIDGYNRKKILRELRSNKEEVCKRWETKFISNHTLYEDAFIKKLKRRFAVQRRDMIKRLQDHKQYMKTKSLIDDLFNIEDERTKFIKIFTPFIADIVQNQAEGVNSFFALGLVDVTQIPSYRKAVDKLVYKFADEVNKTTKKMLSEELAEGLGSGEGIDKLASRIRGVFRNASEVRSITIARTETTKASNQAAILTYKESDIVKAKEWLTTADDRTRAAHLEANGQVVLVDEKFEVGGEELEYPGGGGIASNNINCRCTIMPVIE